MKLAFIFLFACMLLLAYLFLNFYYGYGRGTVDFHFHDTYLVIGYSQVLILALLFLGTFFTLGGMLGTAFRNKYFVGLFLVFLLIDTFLVLWIFEII